MTDDPDRHAAPVQLSSGVERAEVGTAEATSEEWPILADYERPITTRLDHLIATTPNIQTIESNDRKASQHTPSTAHALDDTHIHPPSQQPTLNVEQQGRGAKRSREEKEPGPEWVPTFRGGGGRVESEEAEAGEGTDEERLNRVQPDELYDPQMDERDEQRLQQARALPFGRQSDAVLSCPCCLTILCLDCQRHTQFVHQYRAMFVSHCHTTNRHVHPTATSATNTNNTQQRHRGRRGAGKGGWSGGGWDEQSSAVYCAVECAECGTEVGAVDGDEVYYFFDVLDSASGQ